MCSSPIMCLLQEFDIWKTTSAHVRWFVDNPNTENYTAIFNWTDTPVLVFVSLGILALVIAYVVSLYVSDPMPVVHFSKNHRQKIMRAIQILAGIPLVLCASQGTIIASHIQPGSQDPNWMWTALCSVEMVLGVLLIANIKVRWVYAPAIVLFIGMYSFLDFIVVLEYMGALAVLIYISTLNFAEDHKFSRFKPYTMPFLRIIFGFSLITLGFTEKLLNPGLATQFLAKYPWNFMASIGLDYSDRLFILSSGFVEIMIGIFFVVGIFTRTVAITLFGLLLTSNITFLMFNKYQESLEELFGHSLLFAILLALIFHDRSRKAETSNLKTGKALDQKYRYV